MRRPGTHTSCVIGSCICCRPTAAITRAAGVFRLQPPCGKMLLGSLTGTLPSCCCSASYVSHCCNLLSYCANLLTLEEASTVTVRQQCWLLAFTCVVVFTWDRCCLIACGMESLPVACGVKLLPVHMWDCISASVHLPMGLAVESPA